MIFFAPPFCDWRFISFDLDESTLSEIPIFTLPDTWTNLITFTIRQNIGLVQVKSKLISDKYYIYSAKIKSTHRTFLSRYLELS